MYTFRTQYTGYYYTYTVKSQDGKYIRQGIRGYRTEREATSAAKRAVKRIEKKQ